LKITPFRRLLPLPTATRRLMDAAAPITRTERVTVLHANGRVSAAEVRAARDVPAFARATWDGFTVLASATAGASAQHPVRLDRVGEVYAEERFARRLRPSETVAIATGAAVPRGADAVVLYERVRRTGSTVLITAPVAKGDRLAPPGEEFRRGTRLVADGQLLTPGLAGSLATCGRPFLEVYARPRVAIVPNGNELADPGRPLGPSQIYESNNATIGALLIAAGAEVETYSPVPDDPRQLERAIRGALVHHDVVVSTGGSSVGEHDYLAPVFRKFAPLLFHGIAVRPGKPTLAAKVGKKLLVGMPGHPVSCLPNTLWLLVPLIRRLSRLPGAAWVDAAVRLEGRSLEPSSDISTVVLFRLEDGRAIPTPPHTHAISSLQHVDAFAILPPGAPKLRIGARFTVHRLWPPLGGQTL
jgi:molybdopterin molybdotransferase